MRIEAKPVDWPSIFEQYERSGLNQIKFCEREGIKFIEFKYQRTKHLKQKSKASGFSPIQVKHTSNYELELTLPQGYGLKFKSGVPADYVKRLLSVIR